jgi:hypothetical protein
LQDESWAAEEGLRRPVADHAWGPRARTPADIIDARRSLVRTARPGAGVACELEAGALGWRPRLAP